MQASWARARSAQSWKPVIMRLTRSMGAIMGPFLHGPGRRGMALIGVLVFRLLG